MLTNRIIPCLDVRDGRVVKGIQFSGLRDAGDPVELAVRYEQDGADEIVILDISATPEVRAAAADTVARIRRGVSIPLTVGGGIRRIDDAQRLLEAGADKVAVNSAAVQRPMLLQELAELFGRQCVVVSIDAARNVQGDGWEVVTHSGNVRTGIDVIEWAKLSTINDTPAAGEILLTSWDRDGTHNGYDIDLLRAVCFAVHVPVVASGGAARVEHMVAAFQSGASAVLAASMFHDGETSIRAAKQSLFQLGMEIRTC